MYQLAQTLKARREILGMTQVGLAHASGVSLPSIQNIEADRSNPGVKLLEALFQALGLEMEIRTQGADWDILAGLGVPLTAKASETQPMRPRADSKSLLRHLCLAALELAKGDEVPDCDRKLEAIAATLLALNRHFPDFYLDHCARVPVLHRLLPSEINGRMIKLKRQVLARVSEYL